MAVATERLHLACSQYVDVAARGGRQFNRCTAAIASVVKPARTTIAALRLDQSARIEFYAAGRRIQRYGRIPTVETSAAALCIYPRAGTLDKNPAGSRCREFYRRRAPRGRAFAAITGVAAVGLDNSAGIELDAAVAADQRNGGNVMSASPPTKLLPPPPVASTTADWSINIGPVPPASVIVASPPLREELLPP